MTADLAPPRRVLILKPSSLGDVVTATPILRGLRRAFPDAHISWLLSTSCLPLLKDDDDLDEAVPFDRKRLGRCWRSPGAARDLLRFLRGLRKGQYDWVIDLQGLLRSGLFSAFTRAPVRAGFADAREAGWLFYTHRLQPTRRHTIDRNLELAKLLGIPAAAKDMTLKVGQEARAEAKQIAQHHGLPERGFLLCVPPTRWATKLYPVRHWRQVVRTLASRLPVALLGAPGDEQLCQAVAEGTSAVNLAGKTNLPQMVALIAAGAGVVGSDSAAAFIAPAVGTRSLTIIGPTRLERTGPYAPTSSAVVADVPCQGCLRKRCRHVTCMETIGPAAVLAAAEKMIGNPGE